MRTVVHLDMDCFYAQVEAVRLGIDCRTTPYALIQWGNLIAVNYPARDGGIRRFHDTATTAREKMPELLTSHIATYRMGDAAIVYPDNPPPRIATHKVALEVYRTASRKIFSILRRHEGVTVGKAGIDEAYLDVTEAARRELAALRAAAHSELGVADVMEPSTKLIEDRRAEMTAWLMSQGASLESAYDGPMRALKRGVAGEAACALEGSRSYSVVPHSGTACAVDAPLTPAEATELAENSLLLCAASRVVRRIRSAIYEELHYDCSAGIAHNRLLAKCISATHKPNQQTLLLPDRAASALFDLPLSKLRGFGGKFGKAVQAVCGGASLCREAWLVPRLQFSFLQGNADVSDAGDDDGQTAGRREHAQANTSARPPLSPSRVAARAGSSGSGGAGGLTESHAGLYAYYRMRGLDVDTVSTRFFAKTLMASKIFEPAAEDSEKVRQWLVVLCSELSSRYAEFTHTFRVRGHSFNVKLGGSSFFNISDVANRTVLLPEVVSSDSLWTAAMREVRAALRQGPCTIDSVSVTIGGFTPASKADLEGQQQTLTSFLFKKPDEGGEATTTVEENAATVFTVGSQKDEAHCSSVVEDSPPLSTSTVNVTTQPRVAEEKERRQKRRRVERDNTFSERLAVSLVSSEDEMEAEGSGADDVVIVD